MTPAGRSAEAGGITPFAGLPDRPTCPRCGSFLREGNGPSADNAHGLCDPCRALVASCAPFAGVTSAQQAPPDVNLLELVAGIMLTHDALHPGEPLYVREALAAYGVEVDHVKVWQTVGKLRRRHRLILAGEPRKPGYAVEDWTWEARRVRSSVRGG
ncbi:MAG TPA: hypothetical protein VIJ45_06220 [Coriobacteriia bacterium]